MVTMTSSSTAILARPGVRRVANLIVVLSLAGATVAAAGILTVDIAWGLATLTSVLAAAGAWLWWSRRASSVSAGVLAAFSLSTFFLSTALVAFPPVMIATVVVQLQFGRRGGWVFGGLVWTLVLGGSLLFDPMGGVLLNVAALTVFLLLGLAVGELLAELDRTHRAELNLVRDAALRNLDRALAAERLQQARALHDDLGQQLTLISMGLEVAQRRRDVDTEGAWTEVSRAADVASEALNSMRRQVRAMSPAPAEDHSMAQVLDQLAASFKGAGLKVEVERRGDVEQAGALAYRILQEALTNVVRHSTADRVTVRIDVGERVLVSVADAGGVTAAPQPGFGLTHLRSRIEAVGGRLSTEVTATGLAVRAEYPVEAA